jgi:hypothetical protein
MTMTELKNLIINYFTKQIDIIVFFYCKILNWINRKILLYLFRKFFYFLIKYVNDCLFIFEGSKSKSSFVNNLILQSGDYMKRTTDSGFVFFDITTDVPIYKMFFTLNRSLADVFMLYNRFANRIIEPVSKFFQPLENNRPFFYRDNCFPRKERKKRMLAYHKVFLTKYFFYKIIKDFSIYLFVFFIIIYFFVNNIIFSLIFLNCFFLNYYFLKFFLDIYEKKLRKTILGLSLICYKNYNINNFFYVINGIPLLHTDQNKSRLDLQNEVFCVLDFLKNEINNIFSILIERSEISNDNALPNIEKKELLNFYTKLVNKKIIFLVSYLYNWNIFASAQLGITNIDCREKTGNKYRANIFNFFVKLGEEKHAQDYSEKRYVKSLFEPFYFEEFKHFLEFYSRKEETESTHIEVLKTNKLHNSFYKNIVIFFSRLNIKIIYYTEKIKNKMFNLLGKLDEKKLFRLKLFSFYINIDIDFYYKYKNDFFSDKAEYILFLNSFFNLKPISIKENIPLEKYKILVKNEKNIYNIEKYFSNFDLFTEKLLTMHLLRFSKEDKGSLLEQNIQYFVLEKQFKNFLLLYNGENDLLDQFKYYNDNLNDALLTIFKEEENIYLTKNLVYRKRTTNLDSKIANYKVVSKIDLIKRHTLLYSSFKKACIKAQIEKNKSKGTEVNKDLKKHIKEVYGIDLE